MRLRLLLVAAMVPVGCRDAPAPAARPTTIASHPHAMDRLARLMRAEFSAADPAPLEQRIRCESRRVQRVIGPDFELRQRVLTDSLRTEFASEQFDRLGRRLAQSPLGSADGDPGCRTMDAEAEAEVPLRPMNQRQHE